MTDLSPLILLFVLAVVAVAILAATIGYVWATSTTKTALLAQIKTERDEAYQQAQSQFQLWKAQELSTLRQQNLEVAKAQLAQETKADMQRWQQTELQAARQQLTEALRGEAIKDAQSQFVRWRNEELDDSRRQILELVRREALVNLEKWKLDAEQGIRKDAIDKSQSVTMGKMTEHLVPYLPGFGFNPSDARFIGSPIDLIVFAGLGSDYVEKVVFVEIKTGSSSLSGRERLVRDAIQAGRVEWLEVRANLSGSPVVQAARSKRRPEL